MGSWDNKNKQILRTVHKLLYIVIAVSLAGCSSATQPDMKATIQSIGYLNPNIYNQAAPVVVIIYQLKAPMAFQQASFFALYNNATATLASDLLDKSDIEIQPKEKQVLHIALAPATNYIGVLAAFRDPDKAQWRQVIQVKPGKDIKLLISLAMQSVNIKLK